jgi:DNA replication and repair protein RecF
VRPLAIEALSLRAFRNLSAVDLAPGGRFNVIWGDNGQGKTNLLEGIYVLATSKSFRASKPGDVIQHEGDVASVRASIREESETREQSVGMKPGARLARIEGKRPATLAVYARRTPVVVFHPGEISLSMGGGSERRRLLDRIALYVRAESLDELDRYQRAMRARQKTLETRGSSAADLEHWEELMVLHGGAVMAVRAEAAQRLSAASLSAFSQIAAPGADLDVSYAASAPPDARAYRAALAASRAADLRRGGATVGPHRDDLVLRSGGRPVRGLASQGQHRAAVLALKAAEVHVVGEARGARPILLLDDVSSELDRSRTAALFVFLRQQRGQVFLTTTRPELIELSGDDRRDFRVEQGRIFPM